MADALLSPVVGAGFWVGTLAFIAHAGRKLRRQMNEKIVPLMGVLGAFVFAAQMVNFTIPGTGSSGHLGGGLLLAIVLGPHAAFIVIASVLSVQGLFFADGGLLALGSNIWNLGIYPCYLAYPLVYRSIAGEKPSSRRITLASVVSAVVALQLGSFSVVLQTSLSGVAELPFRSFLLLMQPIHFAIGFAEGIITAGVVNYIRIIRPDQFDSHQHAVSIKGAIITLLVLTVLTGGFLTWFASSNPDGLEWAIGKVLGKGDLPEPADGIKAQMKEVQKRTAVLPEYSFPTEKKVTKSENPAQVVLVDKETSLSGLIGGGVVFLSVVLIAAAVKAGRKGSGPLK